MILPDYIIKYIKELGTIYFYPPQGIKRNPIEYDERLIVLEDEYYDYIQKLSFYKRPSFFSWLHKNGYSIDYYNELIRSSNIDYEDDYYKAWTIYHYMRDFKSNDKRKEILSFVQDILNHKGVT